MNTQFVYKPTVCWAYYLWTRWCCRRPYSRLTLIILNKLFGSRPYSSQMTLHQADSTTSEHAGCCRRPTVVTNYQLQSHLFSFGTCCFGSTPFSLPTLHCKSSRQPLRSLILWFSGYNELSSIVDCLKGQHGTYSRYLYYCSHKRKLFTHIWTDSCSNTAVKMVF